MPDAPSHSSPARHSPAADRNKGPILAELQRLLPTSGRLLEIASGTGQHAAFCAAGLPGWAWQPTDPDAEALVSITAWTAEQPSPGLLPARQLDVLAEPWWIDEAAPADLAAPASAAAPMAPTAPIAVWDALFCANLLHIAPWACCGALMRGAARLLTPAGLLITYGPYLVDGEPTAPGNQAFDADLRERNPGWGLRWLHEVVAVANTAELSLREQVALPANNRLLVFNRQGPGG